MCWFHAREHASCPPSVWHSCLLSLSPLGSGPASLKLSPLGSGPAHLRLTPRGNGPAHLMLSPLGSDSARLRLSPLSDGPAHLPASDQLYSALYYDNVVESDCFQLASLFWWRFDHIQIFLALCGNQGFRNFCPVKNFSAFCFSKFLEANRRSFQSWCITNFSHTQCTTVHSVSCFCLEAIEVYFILMLYLLYIVQVI